LHICVCLRFRKPPGPASIIVAALVTGQRQALIKRLETTPNG